MASSKTTSQLPGVSVGDDSDSITQTDSDFVTETESGTDTGTDIDTDTCTESSTAYPSPEATYEEIIESPPLFFQHLNTFHSSFLASQIRLPTLGGQVLDLYKLFVEVTSRGGLHLAIRDQKWKEIVSALNFPPTVTNASFVVRKHYMALLYHFEQAYYFRRKGPTISMKAPNSESSDTGPALLDSVAAGQLPANSILEPGISIIGTIDGKCDNGYIVSVNLGSEQMKGMLYHIPDMSPSFWDVDASVNEHQKKRRRSRLKLRDPAKPKPNRSGYTFFFAEQYAKLRPSYMGQERSISKKIGHLWNKLSDLEKQVYQEKGRKDKERYKNEMLEYKQSQDL